MTVRGGGVPVPPMASMPRKRMGPPPRSLLPMRIPASWSGSLARRIQGCGTSTMPRAPTRSSPRTSSSPTRPSVPSCSKPSRTSPCGWRYAPSLTASARAGLCSIVGRGEETGCPGRTRKL